MKWQLLVGLFVVFMGCDRHKPTLQIEQSVRGLLSADLSDNGQQSIIASILHGASLWRVKDGERIYNWNHAQGELSRIELVGLSGNGRVGATAKDSALVFWSSSTGKPLAFWELPDKITCIAQNYKGNMALVGLHNGQSMLIDLKQKGYLLKLNHTSSISACYLGRQTTYAGIGTEAGQINIYQFSKPKNSNADSANIKDSANVKVEKITAKKLAELNMDYSISHINLLADKDLALAAVQHDSYLIYNFKTQQIIRQSTLKNTSVSDSIFTDNQLILGFSNRNIEFLETNSWKETHSVRIAKKNNWKPAGVRLEAIAYKNNRLVTTTSDGITSIFQVNDQ